MADDAAAPQKQNASRPQLTSSMRSSSYLSDHQQYRASGRPEPHHGIDTVVEDMTSSKASSPKSFLPFRGIPSEDSPATVVDSGVTHSYSHPNCAPLAGRKSDRLVATLIYKERGAHGIAPGSRSPPQGCRCR